MRALSCAREMENLDRPREPTILFVKTAGRPALPWPTNSSDALCLSLASTFAADV